MIDLRKVIAWVIVLAILANRIALGAPADDLLRSLRPTADVNDFAGILTAVERESLEQRCKELREKTGAQLAVVVLQSLNGGQVDDFTVKLFERWKVGQAGKNNGVMLLVALQDRQARIEVGYGLEPILPDALAGRVLREQLFPAFRQQQYAAGLTATVSRIIEIIERNEPAPANLRGGGGQVPASIIYLFIAIPFVFISSLLLGICLRRGQVLAAGFMLLFPGTMVSIGHMAGIPWVILVIVIASAFGATVLGYHAGRVPDWRERHPRASRRWPPVTTWNWGSGTSSWGGGGFSGGGGGDWGGFGGGSSGGGGASGSW